MQVSGSEILTTNNAAYATRLGIEFKYYDAPTSTFGEFAVFDLNGSYTPVPEPTTLALFGLGLVGIVAWRRKKSKVA